MGIKTAKLMELKAVKVEDEFDVLLEVDGFKRQLRVSTTSTFSTVEMELRKLGRKVYLLRIGSALSELDNKTKNVCVLQRYCPKFGTFVDVTDETQFRDGDRLTVTELTSASNASTSASCNKVS